MNVDYSAYEGMQVAGPGRDRRSPAGRSLSTDGAFLGRAGHGRFLAREPCQYLH